MFTARWPGQVYPCCVHCQMAWSSISMLCSLPDGLVKYIHVVFTARWPGQEAGGAGAVRGDVPGHDTQHSQTAQGELRPVTVTQR